VTTCDDEKEVDEAAFPKDPRGSSLHAPVRKTVAASGGGGGKDEDFKAAVAFETLAATSARALAPCKPTKATSSIVLLMSSGQRNDDEGRADLALLKQDAFGEAGGRRRRRRDLMKSRAEVVLGQIIFPRVLRR